MFELFWDLYQQRQISDIRRTARDTQAESESVRHASRQESQRLDERVDRLVLLVHAMWTLLREKTDITEEDLRKRMTDLDGQDGSVDGRVMKPPERCTCGAVMSRKFHRCLFCGKEDTSGSRFDAV